MSRVTLGTVLRSKGQKVKRPMAKIARPYNAETGDVGTKSHTNFKLSRIVEQTIAISDKHSKAEGQGHKVNLLLLVSVQGAA